MKTYEQLSSGEKALAVERVTETIDELLKDGVIVSENRITRHQVKRMAVVAAESAFYPEQGDEIMHGIVGE